MSPRRFHVYIMANFRRTLYIGVTNNLPRRLSEHKAKAMDGYASRYNLTKLVYYQEFNTSQEAMAHEKRIKGWLRARKIALVDEMNPYWQDLSSEWTTG